MQADDVRVIDEAVAGADVPGQVEIEVDVQEGAAELARGIPALEEGERPSQG